VIICNEVFFSNQLYVDAVSIPICCCPSGAHVGSINIAVAASLVTSTLVIKIDTVSKTARTLNTNCTFMWMFA
jgi:hypothetical protein